MTANLGRADFQRSLLVIAALMVSTTIWVTAVTFGHLLSSIVTRPGTGTCFTVIQMCPGSPTLSTTAIVFVAWGISLSAK